MKQINVIEGTPTSDGRFRGVLTINGRTFKIIEVRGESQ